MKRFVSIGMLALAPFWPTACSEPPQMAEEGTLSVVIPADVVATKGSDVNAFACEQVVNQVQVLLFKEGTRCDYCVLDAHDVTFPYTKFYPSLGEGIYQVYVVANGPDVSGARTENALLSTAVSLADCGLTVSDGFVMANGTSVAIRPGVAAQVSVPLQRFASRVRVVSVTNGLPETYADGGAMTVKGIFLINALGQWNLGGIGDPSGWVNLGGRTAGRQASTDRNDYIRTAKQVPAAYRAHLFRSGTVTIARNGRQTYDDACFYTFPNGVTTDRPGPSATEQTGAPVRLVVLARVNGADWWYPVTLVRDGMGLQRNTTCDVSLTICATGSSDPNEPVTKMQLKASFVNTGWNSGANYSEPL